MATQLKNYRGQTITPKVTVIPKITSGIECAEINGVKIYAPQSSGGEGGGGTNIPRNKYKGLFAEGEIAHEEKIDTELIHVSKNTLFVVQITGTIDADGVEIGVGRGEIDFNDNSTYGKSLIINDTNIVLGSNIYPHELTLGKLTHVSITVVPNTVLAKIDVVNDYGDVFSKNIDWRNPTGKPFVKNLMQSEVYVKLAYYLKDIDKKVWVFGDSYCGYTNYERWPYYVVQDNYDGWLLNAMGGYDANQALEDLKVLLRLTGTYPSVILWALGMNHAGDSSGQVNSDWMAATNELIGICSANSIELVFTTIPSLPNISLHTKTALNSWIKNSGYRYVDMAKAMGDDDPSGNCRGWGTDNALLNKKSNGNPDVHPTARGAKMIYRQVLIDFPEIAIK